MILHEAEVVLSWMRRVTVVFGIARSGIDVLGVRVRMRVRVDVGMSVRMGVMVMHHVLADHGGMPVGVILEREVQRHEQRLQQETHADDDPEESLHGTVSCCALHQSP